MVVDTAGREYLDCLSGAGALALGHHHPVVVEALERTLRDAVPLSTLDLTTPVRDAFVERLFSVLPAHLRDGCIQFCSPSGADAVEAAVKLARTATGREGMVAFAGGYHGMTHGAMALTGDLGPKRALGALGLSVQHLPFPTALRCPYGVGGEDGARLCARAVRTLLEDDHSGVPTPAGVLVEPVQGEGGVHPMPPTFAAELRAATRRAGVPLIADEVQTGVGRTGALWASDRLGLDPDVLVLSKAIGGGLPLAVIVYRRELDGWGPGAHAGTFRGNQLAMAAGEATLRHIVEEELPARAAALGARLQDALRAAAGDDPTVLDVRGAGLMVGVELGDPDTADADGLPLPDGELAGGVQRALLERGVLAERGGRGGAVVRFLPPLIVDEGQIDRIAAAFGGALRAARRVA